MSTVVNNLNNLLAETTLFKNLQCLSTTGILYDSNGQSIISLETTASAVNFLYIFNNSTGLPPTIAATGLDSNVDLLLQGQGTGSVNINNAYILPAGSPTGIGQTIVSTGTGADATTAWGLGSSYTPWSYVYSKWVSQRNGVDANGGASIELPDHLIQTAITAIGSPNQGIIYVVDAFENTENLSITSQNYITIDAPGTDLRGNYTITGSDATFNVWSSVGIFTVPGSNLYVNSARNLGTFNVSGSTTANLTAVDSLQSYASDGSGCYGFIRAQAVGSLTVLSGDSAYLSLLQNAGSITNSGNIYGLVGNTIFGGLGIAASTASTAAYTFPTVDGAPGEVFTTNGSGVVSWAPGGGGGNFVYENAFWVAQNNGSDANAGTSINTPFLTIQAAVNAVAASGSTIGIIYAVDQFVNNEAISLSGTATITIFAPDTIFTGSITNVNIPAFNLICSSASASLTFPSINVVLQSTGASGYTGLIALTSTSQLSLLTNNLNVTNITNDGTCVVNGITGGTLPGLPGNSVVGGTLTIGTALTTGNFYTLPNVDGAPGDVFTTNGSGVVSWAPGGGGSSFTFTNTYFVAIGGNDANPGTNIGQPLATYTQALTLAGATPSTIVILDNGTYTGNISSTGQIIYWQAPDATIGGATNTLSTGTTFYGNIGTMSGDWTCSGGLMALTCEALTGTYTHSSGAGISYFTCTQYISYLVVTAGTLNATINSVNGNVTLSAGTTVNATIQNVGGNIASSGNASLTINVAGTNSGNTITVNNGGYLSLNCANVLSALTVNAGGFLFGNVCMKGGNFVNNGTNYALVNSDVVSGVYLPTVVDNSGNGLLEFGATASAVNAITVTNAATGNAPSISAVGSNTDINLLLNGKGTGSVNVNGAYIMPAGSPTATGQSIVATSTGAGATTAWGIGSGSGLNAVKSSIASGSAVTLSNGAAADVTNITLSPSVATIWLILGNVTVVASSLTLTRVWTSLSSATVPDRSLYSEIAGLSASISQFGSNAPPQLITISGSTIVYLSCYAGFSAAGSGCGNIIAIPLG